MEKTISLAVLLVEDEPTIQLMLRDALRRNGHEVETAADGAEALAALGKRRFDLMISDIHLPKASGMDLFRYSREKVPEMDVMLMTGEAPVEELLEALRQGAAGYLSKPFALAEMLSQVGLIGEYRQTKQVQATGT